MAVVIDCPLGRRPPGATTPGNDFAMLRLVLLARLLQIGGILLAGGAISEMSSALTISSSASGALPNRRPRCLIDLGCVFMNPARFAQGRLRKDLGREISPPGVGHMPATGQKRITPGELPAVEASPCGELPFE